MSFISTGLYRNELDRAGRKLVRRNGKHVLVLSVDGKVHAIANRCPHEGYPLSEGTIGPGCVLTCNWHNWKFDLGTGEALIGRDPVRTYPVDVRGDEIFIDIADPSADLQRERALKGLDAAMADNDFARMAREVARLERAGFDASEALVHAIGARNDRLEGGTGHAHAAAADWLSLARSEASDDKRLAALLEPIGHLAWDTLGVGRFPYAEGVERWDEPRFLDAMEREDEASALARIRGAIADGIGFETLLPHLVPRHSPTMPISGTARFTH
jgi:nitrite reductase/ring-hydroxylating ferredoxin subunit